MLKLETGWCAGGRGESGRSENEGLIGFEEEYVGGMRWM